MKLPQLLKSIGVEAENHKRALQRREVSQAYRKNAQYQEQKNPLLEVLENLLSGKTERDLHTSGQAEGEIENLFVSQPVMKKEYGGQNEENALNTLDLSYKEVSVIEKTAGSSEDENVKAPELFVDGFTEPCDPRGILSAGRQTGSGETHYLFGKVSANYLQHIGMVKNNYRPFDEPSYSKTA